MKRLLNFIDKLINVPTLDPDDARRRRILNVIVLFLFGFIPFGFLAIIAYMTLAPDYDRAEQIQLIIVFVSMSLLLLGVYFINKRYSGLVASMILEVFFMIACAFSDTPQEVADGRSTAVFIMPIILASMILPSYACLIVAAVSCVMVTVIGQTVSTLPNFFTMLMFLMTSVLCWYSSHILQKSIGELRVINRELDASRVEQIVPTLSTSGKLLLNAAAEMLATANDLKQSADAQSNAVRETRVAIRVTSDASEVITSAAHAVRSNADLTLRHSEDVSTQLKDLSQQIQKISEILELIKEIANRSDILSLNAALEGVRAGEAGQGFSIVANQIKKLAENVMSSIVDVKKLIATIFASADTTRRSMEETNRLAQTTAKAGQEIFAVSENQQSSTLAVSTALDNLAEITSHIAASSNQTFAAAKDLNDTASQLQQLIDELTGRRNGERVLA
jgi:methyl-accepting chemotaxis protein